VRQQPKPAYIIDGEPWWNFLYDYDLDGATYQFSICARSGEEAQQRLKKIALARYAGQADGQAIPVSRGWWIPIWCWWRNRAAK
jgi:hypothetical protein